MSKSRVSRIDLPLSRLSSTASSRECFWTARAGAYAIVSNISETVVTFPVSPFPFPVSYHGMVVCRRVPPGHEMLELTLDVGEERRRAEPEQSGPQPTVAELFLH